jgi:putative nucleotidyltransferase with HDIG domain
MERHSTDLTVRSLDRDGSAAPNVKRYLPHALLATTFITVLPAAAVWAFVPTGSGALLVVSVPLAIAVSVAAASAGASFWMRRPGSRDLVFADLMLWGWLRRVRAERRLAHARQVLGLAPGGDARGLTPDRRVEALTRLSELLESTLPDTYGHTRRVTRHAERIARAMHLAPEQVAKVRTAAALHDVGKIHTPREILNKPDRLTVNEYEIIKRHPSDGAEMVAGIEDPEITLMVRHHHERRDGQGYPDGLAGDEIPLGARIIAVADTFDAITSVRSYHGARTHKRALDVLASEAGDRLDATAVTAFLSYYSGRRAVAWSALIAAAPQRVFAWATNSGRGIGASTSSLVQALPAVGAAALLAGPVGSPAARPSPETHAEEGVAHRAAAPARAVVATPRARRRADDAATGRRATGRRRAGAPGSKDGSLPTNAEPAPGPAAGDGSTAPAGASPPAGSGEPGHGGTPQDSTPASDPPPTQTPAVTVPAVELPAVELPSVHLPDVVPPVAVPELPGVDPLPLPDVGTIVDGILPLG